MSESQETAHFLDYWRVIRSRKEMVIAIFLLVVILGVVITFTRSRVYEASALVQVQKESPDVKPFGEDQLWRYDPIFLRTQFEIIQSDPIIEAVIERCGLNEKLGRAYGYLEEMGPRSIYQTFKIVSKSIRVQQFRETNLIEVRVRLAEPLDDVRDEVARVANAVVEVYRDRSISKSREIRDAALAALGDTLEERKKLVDQAENDVEEIRKKYNLTLVFSEKGGEGALGKRTIIAMDELRLEAKLNLEDKKIRFDTVMGLKSSDLKDVAPYLVQDPGLSLLVAEKRKAEIEISRLKESFGSKHPEVVRVDQGIKEIDAKIDEALEGLKTGIKAEYEIARKRFELIEKAQEDLKNEELQSESGGYLEYERAREKLSHARAIRDHLETSYLKENIEQRIPRTIVDIVKPAKPPDVRSFVFPNYLVNIILSVLFGLLAGVGLAYFLEYLDTSMKTIDDIERVMKLPVIGVMPQRIRPLTHKKADQAHAEAYRLLRTNIKFSKAAAGAKTICVTSGSVGEGKSLTLFNLAYTCAQLGDRVLIVDSDLHRPRQHSIMGMSNTKGLANVLVGDMKLADAITATRHPNLDILPSGSITTIIHGLLNSAVMKDVINILSEKYDMVFFDAPPIIGVSDASLLAREVDAVVLVIQHRKYPREISVRAKEMVINVGGNLIGAILNNINVSRDYSCYYYQQHYNYYPKKSKT